MDFLGADTEQMRQWAERCAGAAGELESCAQRLQGAVHGAAWIGPDRDEFVQRFQRSAAGPLAALSSTARTVSDEAVRHAEEQDEASTADSASSPSGSEGDQGGKKRKSPGETESSGPLVDVPDELQDEVDDEAAIREDGERIAQGGMSDCFVLAPLAAIAQTDPGFLERNIWFEDGKYHVRLYEPGFLGLGTRETVIEVDPRVAQNGVRDADGDISTMSIYEAAFAQYKGGYSEIENAGSGPDAYYTLTGRRPTFTDVEPSADELRQALDDGRTVFINTPPEEGEQPGDFGQERDGPPPDDTVGYHFYVVREVRDDGMIVLQNPWGPEGGVGSDGEFKPGELVVTEEEYRARARGVAIGEIPEN